MTHWPLIRDVLLFGGGLTGVIVLTVTWVISNRPPETQLLVLFTAMLTAPPFLRADEKKKKDD